MDIPVLLGAHCASASLSALCLIPHRAQHAAYTLGLVALVDGVLLSNAASWQAENIIAFAGPCAVLVSVALTVGASITITASLATPLLFMAASSVSRGADIGAAGIAWWLVAANVYAAVIGTVLLRIGARKVERFVAAVTGIVIATCAPAIAGWTYRAMGDSVRAATVVDCLFMAVIVVASIVEWTRRRSNNSSSPLPPAHSSTR